MIRLTDSRNRVASGKRYVWEWPDAVGAREAWKIVLDAEIANPEERECYIGFVLAAYASSRVEEAFLSREACETFNDYWVYYGWHLSQYDDDDLGELVGDEISMQPDAPAAETHDR